MPKHLEIEITRLKKRILHIGAVVTDAMHKALLAVHERRGGLAAEIIEVDRKIDRWEVELEEECLKILALHQPVAQDLRFIAAVMKINNDLERMGDEAVNIAEHAAFLAETPPIPIPHELPAMTEAAMKMVQDSLDAFVRRDPESARVVCAADSVVDQLNRDIIQQVHQIMREDPSTVERATHLFSVSRHLERIADHATNIAEDVVYMVEGKIIRHRAEDYFQKYQQRKYQRTS